MKKIIIVFGEMGCGKTYWSKKYAKNNDFEFWDGDSVITPAMLDKVTNFQPIPQHILDEYMDTLFNGIANRAEDCKKETLLVAQALYRDEDRKELKAFLEAQGFEVIFWWLKNNWWRNIRNLLTRENGWKWVYYWLINKPFFQKPTHSHQIAYNVYED